jgi:type IV pilus assembly protein PilB
MFDKNNFSESIKKFLEEQKAQAEANPTEKPEKNEKIELSEATDLVSPNSEELIKSEEQEKRLRVPIGQKLIEKNLITKDQLEIALKIQKDSPKAKMLGNILVEMGLITENTLGEILAEEAGVKRFDKNTIIDPNLIKQIPKEIAVRFKSVPILLEDDAIYIATTDIYNVLALDRLQRYFPKRLKMMPVHASEKDLTELINNYYDYELSIDGILREIEALTLDGTKELIQSANSEDGYTNPTVRLIDAILVDIIQKGGSDIHFEPEGQFIRLRYRIDGRLRLIRSFHRDYWQAIVVRIKIMSEMNITETRNPQDGRINLRVMGREVSFRVAAQPTIHGENIVLRVLDKQKALLPMDKLGFSPTNIKRLHKALKRPEGIIIVTGPTGSGKSTTLYSILSFINTMDVNIMTLEDPVEYSLPIIRQSNIRENSGMDFISGIKSLLRQDPDIIFVGEVRDEGTATMALRAAMTGHQVFTSLHTNDALGAIPRLLDIGVSPRILSGNVICIIAQRLARKLCDHCKEEYVATEEDCTILGIDTSNAPKIFKHTGCEKCDYVGYKGRMAVSEILLVDEKLDDLIGKEAPKSELLKIAIDDGFLPMAEDGVDKVLRGIIDVEELIETINMTQRL